MIMQRISSLLVSLLFCAISFAQTLDDVGKIVIGIDVLETSSKETLELKDYILTKVSHWISQAGYSANGITSFYLYPDVAIDSENVAEGGMKNVYVITGTLYLKIIQSEGNIVFSSISLPFRDSSTSRITAVKNGVGKIQYSQIVPLLDDAKDKILCYYESEKTSIFAQADLMTRQKDYDGAIAYLMSIPSCLTSIYQETLVKAEEVLDKKIYAHNDSILSVATILLAQHNAKATLEALVSYQDAEEDQNAKYKLILSKAEGMVTADELATARERRQQYLDAKEKEHRQWAVEDQERAHRINMDNQQMAYNSAALASNERLISQKIQSDERIASQRISASEHITSQRISAIKNIAASYYRNIQAVKHTN